MAEFSSALTKREKLLAALGFVLHLFVLPKILIALAHREILTQEWANFLLYALMAVYTLISMFAFLRRDFDALADRPLRFAIEVTGSYIAYMFFTSAISSLLLAFVDMSPNPNNEAIIDMFSVRNGMIKAMAVFLAPITEELLFRGFLFSTLRKYRRLWAYAAATLAFALYHVYAHALYDLKNLIYLIQYIPAGILLCRCYERCNTIWCPIALHMLINFMSMQMIERLG